VLTVHALDSELVELRDASNAAPFPIWRLVEGGEIGWANTAYMELLCKAPPTGVGHAWPLPQLFDLSHAKGDAKNKPLRRLSPDRSGWFDVVVRQVSDGIVCYALPADTAALAEGALQDFKQTLTNTFAELSTGLAVFDHNRKLQLFNPALAKLIDAPVDFLLKRPALFALLDGMRDRNMLPEPKDYKSWRHQMVDLEATSLRGEYKETWHLPNGKALRVVGKPYPNGAMALMIDDITDQITRDRLFRGELDVAMAVVNSMDEAVVAFSAVGQPVFSNNTYRRLWGHDPITLAKKAGLTVVLDAWRAKTAPSLVWTEVETALGGQPADFGPCLVELLDGTALTFRMALLPDGGTAIFFGQPLDKPKVETPVGQLGPVALSA
jgi:PAS domain-containing protein